MRGHAIAGLVSGVALAALLDMPAAASQLQRGADTMKQATHDAACTTRCQRPTDMLALHKAQMQQLADPTATPTATADPRIEAEHRACVQRCMDEKVVK
ncbi:MAG: hypothetical protein EBV03_05095 [Proteobacteria bacterium]|nr:hypothetical protein [Pseudomonadota bacterium]